MGNKLVAILLHSLLVSSNGFVAKGWTPYTPPLVMQSLDTQRLQRHQGLREVVEGRLCALGSLTVNGTDCFRVCYRQVRGSYSNEIAVLFMQLVDLSKAIAVVEMR